MAGQEVVYSFRVNIVDQGKVSAEIVRTEEALRKLNQARKDSAQLLKEGKITQQQHTEALVRAKTQETQLRQEKLKANQVARNYAQQTLAVKGSMERLRLETALLRREANNLNLTTTEGRKRFSQLQAQIKQNTTSIRDFDRRMSGSRTLVGEYGRGIVQSFKSMAAGLVGFTALLRSLRDLVKVSGDFDTATAKLASVTGQTREEISDLTATAKQLGSTSIFTASQVTDLQVALAKLGFTAKDIQNSTAAVVSFATATGSDLGAAAKTAGVAVRAFGLDTLETENAVATLAVATTKSALAFEDYETILSTAGPVARAFGFTLEDTAAFTGKLRDAGFDASKAGTAFRNVLLNLADANGALAKRLGGAVKNSDQLIDALIKLNTDGIDLAETLELTDKRSVAAFNQFLAGAESVRELRDGITGVNGELEQMVETQLDSFAGDVASLKSAWEGLILAMKGTGPIRNAIQTLADAIRQVQNLDLAVRKFNKQDADQIARSFDLLNTLFNEQGAQFQALVKQFDEYNLADILADPEYFRDRMQQVRKVNKEEAGALVNEYIRRRWEQGKQEEEVQAVTAARLAAEAEQQEKNEAAAVEKVAREEREKAAKQREKDEKKAAEKAKQEAIKAEEEKQREIESYKKQAASDSLKIQKETDKQLAAARKESAGMETAILGQQIAALQAQEELSVEEQLARSQRITELEIEIRRRKFQQETIDRDRAIAETEAAYAELETKLAELNKRMGAGEIDEAFYMQQANAIATGMQNISQQQQELDDQRLTSEQQLQNDLTAIAVEGAQDRVNIEKKSKEEQLATVGEYIGKASELVNSFGQLFEAQKQKELSAVGDNAAKREEIERKYARKQQLISIAQAVLNVAQGITKAIAQGGVLGLITGAIVAAAGAAQVAVIRSQKFAEGGMVQPGSELPGAPRTGDNTLAMVKPGEVILNKTQQAALGGTDIFRRIGVPGFASGGVVGSPQPVAGVRPGMDLAATLANIKVILNINELHDAEDELTVINETAEV